MSANDSDNYEDKENGSNYHNNSSNNNENGRPSSSPLESPVLATKYAHRAATLVRSIEKNSYVIIGIIIALLTLSTLDLLEIHVHLPFSFDSIITVFSVASVIALLFMLSLTAKSRRVLEDWADVFERNSIAAGIMISMNSRTREEVVHAIAENIEEIGPQLQKYISSKDKYDEFFDITFGKDTEPAATTAQFDIIIDKDNLKPTKNNSYQELKLALQNYGSVIVKFVDGTIDGNVILSVSNL
ncbi:MAG TPA: hypothetical protein VH500_25175, partial [Nitrososphaeraceae archaeon]